MKNGKQAPNDNGERARWWARFRQKDIVELAPVGAAIVFVMVAIAHQYLITRTDIGRAGQTGDFFGGILNPALAFFALLVLVRATKIQKTEMEEARRHFQSEARRSELYRMIESGMNRLDSLLDLDVDWSEGFATKHYRLRLILDSALDLPPSSALVTLPSGDQELFASYCYDRLSPALDHLVGLTERYEAIDGATGEMSGFFTHHYGEVKSAVDIVVRQLIKQNAGRDAPA